MERGFKTLATAFACLGSILKASRVAVGEDITTVIAPSHNQQCQPPTTSFKLAGDNYGSMSWSGVWELAQMERGWLLPSTHRQQKKPLSHDQIPSTYDVQQRLLRDDDGWLKYDITEPENHEAKGGSSFFATVFGEALHICAVQNYFNGSYTVVCPRPQPGSCAMVKVVLEWEFFEAYHNDVEGGGKISPNAGGRRGPKAQTVLHEQVCESAHKMLVPALKHAGHWFLRSSVLSSWAEWQFRYVWQDSCEHTQKVSAEHSEEIRRCFSNKLVEFMGDSHIDYVSMCLMDEVLQFKGVGTNRFGSKVPKEVQLSGTAALSEAGKQLQSHGKGPYLYEAKYAANRSEFEYVRKCGDRMSDCLRPLRKTDCYFEEPHDLRVCTYRTTSLGSSVSLLSLMYLNLPPTVTPESPWTEDRVVVIMNGHWDAASQRDPRSYLEGEWPTFISLVEKIRADPRTRRMRILFDGGPALNTGSTGWRNNHALAAVAAYLAKTLASRPDLGIELINPSFFHLTLPRKNESADGLHFLIGAHQNRHETTDGTGDISACKGPVGEAYARLLLDQICNAP